MHRSVLAVAIVLGLLPSLAVAQTPGPPLVPSDLAPLADPPAKVPPASPPPAPDPDPAIKPLDDNTSTNANQDAYIWVSAVGNTIARVPIQATFQPVFDIHELELGFQGYMSPFAKADVFISKPGDGDVELEEAYVTLFQLPLSLEVRLGRMRVPFGLVNRIHPHERACIDQPLIIDRFLGEDGLADDGIAVSGFLPFDFLLSEIRVSWLRGASETFFNGGKTPMQVGAVHWTNGFDMGDAMDASLNGDALYGTLDPEKGTARWATDLSATWRYRFSTQSALTLSGEWLVAGDIADTYSNGFYVAADLNPDRNWFMGIRYDWSQKLGALDEAQGGIAFLGYHFTEQFQLRAQYRYLSDANVPSHELSTQLIYVVGPHKPHL